jgi:hypothetical protein
MPPAIHVAVEREALLSVRLGWDYSEGAPRIETLSQPIGVESPVAQQGAEDDAFNQGRHPNEIMALAGQEDEADQIAERIHEGDNLGGQTAA